MKIILSLFLCLVFILNLLGAPLIFKIKKEINSPEAYAEIATVDVSKYKKIRVSIKRNSAANKQIEGFRVYSVENGEDFEIGGGLLSDDASEIIELPSNSIRVAIKGSGTFTLYVHATQ